MEVELQATCSALGYLEGNEYIKEPDCIETVKDLIRFLRRDTDICDIRRQLGHAQIVQNDLIPLVKFYHTDKTLFDMVLKLLVNLTQPVITCFNNEIPDEKTLRNYCLEVEGYLQDYKEAFIDEDLYQVLAEKIENILKLEWDQRREEDKLQLERLFVLIRNVLLIPPDPSREKRTEDDASTHDQILWTMHISGVEDLILYVASSDGERGMLCMHMMETISLMFREQEAETLASAGVQRSMTEKEKDQKELEHAREQERAQKKANILKFSARHSRFGGTYVIKNMKSISDSDVIYHKPLCEVKSFSYDDGKVPKKKAKNRAPIKGDSGKRRSTLSMRLSLKEFCVQFLVNAYNPLMRAVKDALTRKTAQDNDETYYLWAMRFFMEFCRLSCRRVDLVSETMSLPSFHYIYTQLVTYYENVRLGKGEERKTWGQRSHLALKAYQELLRTLDFMSRSKDEQIRESAKVIQSNVFYMIEYRDVFITLLKHFKEAHSSRAYLRDLVESTHIFLKMLEVYMKGNKHLMVQKKKTKRRKKKKNPTSTADNQHHEMTEEELEALWDQEISGLLSEVVQGRQPLPEGVTPFDAASQMDMDEQRVEAMLRIQACLRDKNPGEATALFRAAREVWPEREEFGSESMGSEEEFMALREIFMANLPRPQSQVEERNEELEEGENNDDDDNDAEEEEREQARSSETDFNFKTFILDFVHHDVIKSYGVLLDEFSTNSDLVNHCVVKMLHRVSHDLGYVGILFQASIFKSFSSLLHGPYAGLARYKELSKFACYVIRQFTRVAEVNKKVFVDLLFWKTKTEALAITGDYDFVSKGKAKVLWTEHEEQELLALYEKYRDVTHPEMDTVDLILGELTSSHTRSQVLRELKKQGLITSVKDIKKKQGGSRVPKWTDEEVEELRDAFDRHKDSKYPVADIMKTLTFKKSRSKIINKILDLGLVDDREQLMKRGRGRRGKGRGGGSDDDSDEGERLFPETNDRDRRRRKNDGGSGSDSDDDGSYHEGDSDEDDDDDVRLMVRQAASTVGDYVSRLVEHGYKDQIAWIRRGLRNTAEDRDEGICVPTPIVPLTEENETAMEDDIFLIFLRSVGIASPANEQQKFWRIPAEFSAADLNAIADGLEISESGEAANADAVQQIVARVFPQLTSLSPGRQKEPKMKKKKESKKEKRRRSEDSKKTQRKVTGKKALRNKMLNGDEGDDNLGNHELSGSDERVDSSSSDEEGKDRRNQPFVPVIPGTNKDSDTSDSGLDPEIEAKEQERLWAEKSRTKKSSSKKTEERRNALKQMIERKNKKNNRKDRAKGRREPETADKSQTKQSTVAEVTEKDNEHMEEEDSNLGSSSKSIKKSQQKKAAVLDSDSDCDTSSLSSLSPSKSQEGEQMRDEQQISHSRTDSKKRLLDSDTDSQEKENSPIKKKTTKRIRFLPSDDESSDDNSGNDGENKNADNKEDSDKENITDRNNGNESTSLSQHEESLRLHFSSSDEEEVDRTAEDKSAATQAEDKTSKTHQDNGNGNPSQKDKDSFPATLFTQMLDSDEEDDHIPLRTAIKRRRAVVDDDEDD